MDEKLVALTHVYRVLENTLEGHHLSCHRGCPACCTLNVTMTTLEAYQIINSLSQTERMDVLDRLSVFSEKSRFIPRLTINALARHCAESDEIPEEQHILGKGVCPLLIDDTCAIYTARPLACRAMVSNRDCRLTGYATMDPFVLSVNNVLMQFAEHIDRDGLTGNLTDVLYYLSIKENRHAYQRSAAIKGVNGLVANRSLTVLMVPPEHRQRMVPILKSLNPGMGEIA
jgi:Fe-S-cluster containining protein